MSGQPSVVSGQMSAESGQPSAVSSQKSAVSSQMSAVSGQIRPLKIVFVFLSIAVFFAGCFESKPKQVKLADDRSYAASIFRQNCAICHGQEAEGKEVSGKLVPSLRIGKATALTDEQIFTQISNGGNGMLPFKQQLSEKDIHEMVKFVKHSLQGRE